MKKHLFLTGILICSAFIANSQSKWEIGFYDGVDDFKKQTPTVPCRIEAKPYPNIFKSKQFLPNLYRLIPKETQIPYTHFKNNSILAWDGKNLFLNVQLLRMSLGFVKVGQPQAYILFIGREQGIADWGTGSSGWVSQENGETDMLAHKPIVFDLNTGRVHPFTPSTIERILESYPEILSLYIKDPNWKTEETMTLYLEILNGMIETEVDN
jgi:hypothetical protein